MICFVDVIGGASSSDEEEEEAVSILTSELESIDLTELQSFAVSLPSRQKTQKSKKKKQKKQEEEEPHLPEKLETVPKDPLEG